MINIEALLKIISDFTESGDRGNFSLALYRWLFLKVKHAGDSEINLNIADRLNVLRSYMPVIWVHHLNGDYELAVEANNQRVKLSRPTNSAWANRYIDHVKDLVVNSIDLNPSVKGSI